MHTNKKTMLSAFIKGPRDIQVSQVPVPEVGPSDALLKINSCGICGSDLHRYLVDAYGRKFNYPLNSGHEYCAEIVETGKKVKNFKVGDQVTGDVVWKETGGAFAQYLMVPEADKRLLQINSITNSSEKMSKVDFVDLDPHHIALVEPVGIAVKAFAFGCPPGSSSNNKLAIIGSGTIGLSLLLTSIVRGFKNIVVSEPSRLRRDIAQSIGAVVVNPKASDSLDQFRRAFLAFEGEPNQTPKRIENNFSVDSRPAGWADVVFECAGTQESLSQAVALAGMRGIIVLVALHGKEVSLPATEIITKGLTIKSVYGKTLHKHTVEAVDIISKKKQEAARLITHSFSLSDIKKGFELACQPEACCKIMIDIS